MMAVQQRSVSGIEEVLITDSEDDDVVILDDDDDQTNKFEETKEFIHAIDYERSSTNCLYNNGDFEHLPQLFMNQNLQKTEEIYLDEEYDISDASNHSSNEAISVTNVNLSDKENVPVKDSVRIESNDRSADSDDDKFYIAEDCNTKDVSNHSEGNEKMNVDVDIASLSNNYKEAKNNVNSREECKKVNADKAKQDSIDTAADKLEINESTVNAKNATDKSQDMKSKSEELTNETSSDDDSEDAQDCQVVTVALPNQGFRSSKRRLRMHCEHCNVVSCVPKLHKLEACICRVCGSAMDFQCKKCERGFKTYWAALNHLKRECAAKYFWHCPECDYAIRQQAKFDLHIQNAHKNKTLRCPHCRKFVYNEENLDTHIKAFCPMKAPRFHCNSCDFKERLLSQMKRHVMESHCVYKGGFRQINRRKTENKAEKTTKLKPESEITNTVISAPVPKVVEEKLNMAKLIKLHCTKCKITFKKTADIGTKCKYCNTSMLYQCKLCKERIKSLCGIYDHLDNNCEFVVCKKCNDRFKTKVDAIKHKEACGGTVYKCKFCSFRAKRTKALENHINAKHNDKNITAQK